MAQAYSKAGQNDRIVKLLRSYLEQKDISSDAFLQAAQAYWNVGQHDAALNALQLMTERFPQDPRGYYYVAIMRAMENNADVAIPMLEKAIALAPQLRAQAANDQQFGSLRGNPRFQQIVGSP